MLTTEREQKGASKSRAVRGLFARKSENLEHLGQIKSEILEYLG